MNIPLLYRQCEIDARRHAFRVSTPAERRERRGRFIDAAIITITVLAVATCGVQSLSPPPPPGAVPEASKTAPGPLTYDTAPVRWRKSDFPKTPSSVRVAPTTKHRRPENGKSSGRLGVGDVRKAAK